MTRLKCLLKDDQNQDQLKHTNFLKSFLLRKIDRDNSRNLFWIWTGSYISGSRKIYIYIRRVNFLIPLKVEQSSPEARRLQSLLIARDTVQGYLLKYQYVTLFLKLLLLVYLFFKINNNWSLDIWKTNVNKIKIAVAWERASLLNFENFSFLKIRKDFKVFQNFRLANLPGDLYLQRIFLFGCSLL